MVHIVYDILTVNEGNKVRINCQQGGPDGTECIATVQVASVLCSVILLMIVL